MTDPEVRVTAYEVSCLPQDSVNNAAWALKVKYRGHGKWAVLKLSQCLAADGKWDYEHIPGERSDEWLAEHRFDLDTALRLAQEAAPHVVISGMTPAQVLEWEATR